MKKLLFLLFLLTFLLCGCLPSEFFSPHKITTTNQETINSTPETTTLEPEVTTSEPEVTTSEPEVTTSEPEVTTPEELPCEHTFEGVNIKQNPTCTRAGAYTVTCSCGAMEIREIPATGTHDYINNVCTWCQKKELSLVPVTSQYDADGDGKKDVYGFSPNLAQRCKNGVFLWAGNYDKGLSAEVSNAVANEIEHWYVEANSAQRLTYRITVPEAGVYEMIVHLRLKDDYVRGAKYTFNQGTELEQIFETSHVFGTTTLTQARNAETMGTYMYGIRVYLQGGENIFSITAHQGSKTQHFREFYFVKTEEVHTHNFASVNVTKQPTCSTVGEKTLICSCGQSQSIAIPATGEHSFVNNVCTICKEKNIPLYANTSNYDADGDGELDVYYFSPEQSNAAKQGIHFWAGNYDEKSSVGVKEVTISGVKHWYVESDGSLEYRITVPERGIYEMVLYLRLKDSENRGARYIINEGTAFEQVFETSHEIDEETLNKARDTTVGAYMYGISVSLVAGENTIKITPASSSFKAQHFRDFYFVKTNKTHLHAYLFKTVLIDATCASGGKVVFTCSCGLERTVSVSATANHIYVDEICLLCEQEKQDFGITDYAFLSQKAGFAGGTVSLFPEVTGVYQLYWGTKDGKLASYTMLGSFVANAGKVNKYVISANVAIPTGATHLIALNTSGGRYVYSFTIPEEHRLTSKELYLFGALSDTHQGTRYGEESVSLERLINAGQILSQKGAILIGINGDIANDNVEREYVLHSEAIQSIFKTNSQMPIYTVSGNHEAKYTGFSREWYLEYTRDVVDYQTDLDPIFTDGNDLDFFVEMPDGSVIIFLHQVYYDYGTPTSRLMDDYQLDWLGDRFEEYKDRTVFLFFHSQMQGKVGDLNGNDALIMRTDTEDYKRLDAYFKQYTNVVYFNGHSHGSFDVVFSEKYGDRIFNTYGGEYATLVHIPSLAQSQLGHIVHVYEDCIVFEGYHFGKEQTFAYATFIIEK
ncbi:MAG: hypothetical protein E7584_03040 [Ruminococcaceae bacterium]|nr:hypothetical protein [Oscillospiraceae bacterium]